VRTMQLIQGIKDDICNTLPRTVDYYLSSTENVCAFCDLLFEQGAMPMSKPMISLTRKKKEA
jgi:hypothetical protein